ncbi:Uncharacterised protein [BD1-7 clade bacterium]|nr:Uncharacterised protein [BD1-7 clade bacterium]
MAKVMHKRAYTAEKYESSLDESFKVLLSQEVAKRNLDINAHELFNQLLKEERGKRLYMAGETRPASGLRLHLEAERASGHSAKLWRGMRSQAITNGTIATK